MAILRCHAPSIMRGRSIARRTAIVTRWDRVDWICLVWLNIIGILKKRRGKNITHCTMNDPVPRPVVLVSRETY